MQQSKTTQPLPPSPNGRFFSYEITTEPVDNAFQNLPEPIQEEMEAMLSLLKSTDRLVNVKQMIDRLEELEKIYPDVLTFSNYIGIIYQKNNPAKLGKFLRENYRKHPKYLFARIQYADYCIEQKRFKKVEEIFKEGLELSLLYPERKVFHLSEYVSFFCLVCRYYAYTYKLEQAEQILQNLQDIAPEHPNVKSVAAFVKRATEFWLTMKTSRKSTQFEA